MCVRSLRYEQLKTFLCDRFMCHGDKFVCASGLILCVLSYVIRAFGSLDGVGLSNASWLPIEFTASMEWQAYNSRLCALHIGQQQLCSLLGPSFLSHNYTLTPTQLKRASTFTGPNHRLRRVVRDLITGKAPISVGVIGTSISWGTGKSMKGRQTEPQKAIQADAGLTGGSYGGGNTDLDLLLSTGSITLYIDTFFISLANPLCSPPRRVQEGSD